MTDIEAGLMARIEALLAVPWADDRNEVGSQLHLGTVSIATLVYGAASPQVAAIVQAKADIRASNWSLVAKEVRLVEDCRGALRAIAGEIRSGLPRSIRLAAQSEVFADFVKLAKAAADSGAKDVAAVLAAASLEDALKKLAVNAGLSVDDREMSEVINALKAAGQLSGADSALLKGFVQIRNRSLHAEWDKVDAAGVLALIAFSEQFILSRLT